MASDPGRPGLDILGDTTLGVASELAGQHLLGQSLRPEVGEGSVVDQDDTEVDSVPVEVEKSASARERSERREKNAPASDVVLINSVASTSLGEVDDRLDVVLLEDLLQTVRKAGMSAGARRTFESHRRTHLKLPLVLEGEEDTLGRRDVVEGVEVLLNNGRRAEELESEVRKALGDLGHEGGGDITTDEDTRLGLGDPEAVGRGERIEVGLGDVGSEGGDLSSRSHLCWKETRESAI